jgi:hypothetical protein
MRKIKNGGTQKYVKKQELSKTDLSSCSSDIFVLVCVSFPFPCSTWLNNEVRIGNNVVVVFLTLENENMKQNM